MQDKYYLKRRKLLKLMAATGMMTSLNMMVPVYAKTFTGSILPNTRLKPRPVTMGISIRSQ